MYIYSKRTKVFEHLSLLPLMAQMAQTHIDTWKWLQPRMKYHIFMTINDGKLSEQITDGMQVSICVSATCAISGKSGMCSNTFVPLEYIRIYVYKSRIDWRNCKSHRAEIWHVWYSWGWLGQVQVLKENSHLWRKYNEILTFLESPKITYLTNAQPIYMIERWK